MTSVKSQIESFYKMRAGDPSNSLRSSGTSRLDPIAEAPSDVDVGQPKQDCVGSKSERKPLLRFAAGDDASKLPSSKIRASRRPFHDKYNDSTYNLSTMNLTYPSGLDFERVVNNFSIEASRDRYIMPLWGHDQDNDKPDSVLMAENEEYAQARYDAFEDPSALSACSSMGAPPLVTGRRKQKPFPWGYTGRTAVGWIFCVLTGILTACIAIFLASQTGRIRDFRSLYLDSLWQDNNNGLYTFLAYAGFNLALALLSSMLCLFVAPNAVGSGIPEVKAFLNGVRVQRFSSFRLFLVKIVGTILSVSTDLAIGPEGPLVQIGAIIGASCTKLPNFLCGWFPPSFFSHGFWKFITIDLSHFATDKERRILVCIGSAAGFAAAFGAPIGGLLFAVEETSTYIEASMFTKTLTATVVGTFLLSVYHGDLSEFSIISLGKFDTPDDNIFLNRVEEFPLYLLVAVAGGLMGGLFCNFWKALQLGRMKFFPAKKWPLRWKLTEVAFVSVLTSTLMFYVPILPQTQWTCRTIANTSFLEDYIDHSHQFDCPDGHINELATIFFGNREDAISDILSNPAQFQPMTLWTTGAVFFFCMTLTLGVALPSGIFMPTFLVGTSMGGAAGLLFQKWVGPDLAPATFALLGAASLLAGIQRTTVSICVILVEGTGQVKTLIPVIFTVMVAKYVGDRVSGHGLYELAMEINRYPFLQPGDKKFYDIFPVRDIMSHPPITLAPREKAHTIVRLLKESVHNGFPVVDPTTKRFLGLVRRDQLVALLECGVVEKEPTEQEPDFTSNRLKPWIGPSGWGSSPDMLLAYDIRPDRYSHVEHGEPTRVGPKFASKVTASPPGSTKHEEGNSVDLSTSSSLESDDTNRLLDQDEFDNNAWFLAARRALKQLETQFGGVAASDSRSHHLDTMPSVHSNRSSSFASSRRSTVFASPPCLRRRNVATVGLNNRGNVYVKWLDPDYEDKLVPVADVMNIGSYCVHEHMPVSKAYLLFTAMGLRHLVVLGGATGGEVVGILSRINFLNEFIEERTGCEHLKDH
ncbi:hypothetical protein ACA910_007882 [Epithemia clementina (nom. ined.)]